VEGCVFSKTGDQGRFHAAPCRKGLRPLRERFRIPGRNPGIEQDFPVFFDKAGIKRAQKSGHRIPNAVPDIEFVKIYPARFNAPQLAEHRFQVGLPVRDERQKGAEENMGLYAEAGRFLKNPAPSGGDSSLRMEKISERPDLLRIDLHLISRRTGRDTSTSGRDNLPLVVARYLLQYIGVPVIGKHPEV